MLACNVSTQASHFLDMATGREQFTDVKEGQGDG